MNLFLGQSLSVYYLQKICVTVDVNYLRTLKYLAHKLL